MTGIPIESRQTISDLLAFHEIARALTSSQNIESTLAAIMGQMERSFRPEGWALLLTDERRRDLYFAMTDARGERQLAGTRIAYGHGLAGSVAERGEMLVMPNVVAQSLVEAGFDPRPGLDVRSAICIPLRSRLRTLGVIQMFNLAPEMFSEHAISRLKVLSDFAAIAIENARAFERVQELTITDECTGLYNLRHFEEMLRSEIARSERLSTSFSLIFIDLDHFKQVNDQYGHQVGSQLLAAVGNTIKSHVRSIDLAFRYGGDEFIVLLPGTGQSKAVLAAERLLLSFRKTNYPIAPGININIRASLGVSSFPEDGPTAHQLLRTADARMYQVKESTRDGIASTGTADKLDNLDRAG
jgi:diguanylate cyclase (GGDEF)-like protein